MTKITQYTIGIDWVSVWGSKSLYSANPEPKLTNPVTPTAYSLLPQKCIFNVNHIDTSCGNSSFLSGDGTDKKYRSDFTKTRHFKRKIIFFLGGGLTRGAVSHHPTLRCQSSLPCPSPCVLPRNYSRINACGPHSGLGQRAVRGTY